MRYFSWKRLVPGLLLLSIGLGFGLASGIILMITDKPTIIVETKWKTLTTAPPVTYLPETPFHVDPAVICNTGDTTTTTSVPPTTPTTIASPRPVPTTQAPTTTVTMTTQPPSTLPPSSTTSQPETTTTISPTTVTSETTITEAPH